MKKQFRSLNLVLCFLLLVLGLDAFTRPTEIDSIDQEVTEGKIAAAEKRAMNTGGYHEAREVFVQMKVVFNAFAKKVEDIGGDVQKLSMLSQTLYLYEVELNTTNFSSLTAAQRVAFLTRLNTIRLEFFSIYQKTN